MNEITVFITNVLSLLCETDGTGSMPWEESSIFKYCGGAVVMTYPETTCLPGKCHTTMGFEPETGVEERIVHSEIFAEAIRLQSGVSGPGSFDTNLEHHIRQVLALVGAPALAADTPKVVFRFVSSK